MPTSCQREGLSLLTMGRWPIYAKIAVTQEIGFFKLVDDSGTYKPSYPCPCCDKVLFPVSFSDSQEEACLIIDDEGQAVDWTCPDCGSHSITQSLDEIWHQQCMYNLEKVNNN